MKNLILASTSTVYGSDYLDYLKPALIRHFNKVSELLFIPYARPGGLTHDSYTELVRNAFAALQITVRGIHEYPDPKAAVQKAQGIFVGGGNTFVLVNELYKQELMAPLKQAIDKGTPYLGTSAGSNICGISMQTTNDMPIVAVPSYQTLGSIPFNINAHYLDPDPDSTHKGETREERIREFHNFNDLPVLGLREGSWLEVNDREIRLLGSLPLRLFKKELAPVEVQPGENLMEY